MSCCKYDSIWMNLNTSYLWDWFMFLRANFDLFWKNVIYVVKVFLNYNEEISYIRNNSHWAILEFTDQSWGRCFKINFKQFSFEWWVYCKYSVFSYKFSLSNITFLYRKINQFLCFLNIIYLASLFCANDYNFWVGWVRRNLIDRMPYWNDSSLLHWLKRFIIDPIFIFRSIFLLLKVLFRLLGKFLNDFRRKRLRNWWIVIWVNLLFHKMHCLVWSLWSFKSLPDLRKLISCFISFINESLNNPKSCFMLVKCVSKLFSKLVSMRL